MKKLIIIFLAFFAFASCEPKLQPKKPDNLIAKDKMTEVLYDMFVINSAKGLSRNKFEKLGLNPEKYILQKHSIDSLQFAKSNDFYAHDIEVYKEIIEAVKTRITKEKEKFTAIDKKETEEKKRVKDSINKSRQMLKANPNIKKVK